jgi:hypothetical protein
MKRACPGKSPSHNWCHMDLTRIRLDDSYGFDRIDSSHWDAWSGTTRLDWKPGHALPSFSLAPNCDHFHGAPHPNLALTGRLRVELIHFLDWDGTRAPMSF